MFSSVLFLQKKFVTEKNILTFALFYLLINIRVLPTGRWGVSYCSQKFAHPPNKFLSPLSPTSCSHCSDTIFILTEYSLYRHVMLILILIDIQHLQNVAFAFENGSNGQNHSLPDTSHSLPHWGGFFSGRLFLTHL